MLALLSSGLVLLNNGESPLLALLPSGLVLLKIRDSLICKQLLDLMSSNCLTIRDSLILSSTRPDDVSVILVPSGLVLLKIRESPLLALLDIRSSTA